MKVKVPGSFEMLGTANVVTRHDTQKTLFFSRGFVVSNYSFLSGTLKYQACSSYNSVVLDSSLSFLQIPKQETTSLVYARKVSKDQPATSRTARSSHARTRVPVTWQEW